MTTKERKTMLENWVKKLNAKAKLEKADPRCGNRYAVVLGTHNPITSYLPLNQLEQYLTGVLQHDRFLNSISKSK